MTRSLLSVKLLERQECQTLYESPEEENQKEKVEILSHPYHDFEGTLLWNLINKGINDLSDNQDINEMTSREHIVGYLCSQLKFFIKTELDGAEIVEISNKGSYGYIIAEDGKEIEISYLTICNYKGKSEFYLFECDNSFKVIRDTVHSSIEEAKATINNDIKINWMKRILKVIGWILDLHVTNHSYIVAFASWSPRGFSKKWNQARHPTSQVAKPPGPRVLKLFGRLKYTTLCDRRYV